MWKIITEFLGVLFGAIIFGSYFFSMISSGNLFKAFFGFIFLAFLGSFMFVITKRTIDECIQEYKEKKKGGLR